MNRLHDMAQLLVSCWVLAADTARIPTSHGVFDRALKKAYDLGAFPPWAREQLHFVDSRIGLQCIELPTILDWAQTAELTSAPNPSYRMTEVQVSQRVARRLLRKLNVAEADARQWGVDLTSSLGLASHGSDAPKAEINVS